MRTHSSRKSAIIPPFYFLALAALLPLSVAATAESPDRLDIKIDLDLVDAKAGDVFSSVGGILGVKHVETDDDLLDVPVTIRVNQVTMRTVLNAICESIGCLWKLVGEEGAQLLSVVDLGRRAEAPEDLDGALGETVSLSLAGAQFRDVANALSQILNTEIVIQEGLEEAPTVTLELQRVSIDELLDAVCGEVDCSWSLEESEAARTLTFEPAR